MPSSRAPRPGGRREQLTGRQCQPCLPDLLPLLIQPSPHHYLQARGLHDSSEFDNPRSAADQKRPGASGPGDAQSPGGRHRGQAVKGHCRDDHHERGRQDLGGAADALGDQARSERRRGGGGDDAAWSHPADERTLAFCQVRSQRGRERGDGPGHENKGSRHGESGQQQVLE
jgi:hypothetical protein